MKKVFFFLFSVSVINSLAQYPRVDIPGSEVRKVTSSIVSGQEYELHILLPGGYKNSDKKYPVVYLMDSQWDFPLVKCIYGEYYYDGFIPEMIIVGVTWGGVHPNPDSLRARDYTPTKESRLPQSGGADKFLSFMKNELFPFIETNYKASSENRTLMGCSLGGLITLYAWLTHTDMFTGYAAASPAVGWGNGVLYQYEKDFSQKKLNKPVRVYMTVGDVERGSFIFEKMADLFDDRHYQNVNIRSKILENTEHSGTKGETFARGLQYVFEKPKLKLESAILNKYSGKYVAADGNKVEIKNENGILVIYLSAYNKYSLYAARETEFYSTAEFFNVYFKSKGDKIDGFQLERYGNSQFIKKLNDMRMNLILFFLVTGSSLTAQQNDSLQSGVYYWNKLEPAKEDTRIRRQILDGKTFALANFEIHTSTLEPGKAPHPPHSHTDQDELMIVKEGTVKITIGNKSRILGPGSIAFTMPADEHGIENAGNTQATYFILKFKGKAPMSAARAKQAGGSFMLDWNDLKTSGTGKGYRRDFFNRATSQLAKFEMHTTALNADSVSHAPHTHIQEEIVLIIRGNVEMQIGNEFYKGETGDLYFLSSNDPHALKNIGKDQCEYFAFQWRN